MKYGILNHDGFQITQGSFEECEEVRRHYLDTAMMKRFRLLAYIYDNRAGAIAFRTALDKQNELICARKATAFRQQLAHIAKEIAYYRAARPVEISRKVA